MKNDNLVAFAGICTAFVTAVFGMINLLIEKGSQFVAIGLFLFLFFVILFLAVYFLLQKKKCKANTSNEKACITRSLREHRFFSDMQKYINRDIPHLKIANPLKKLVVCEFLKIKFEVFIKSLTDYIINTETAINTGVDIRIEDIQGVFFTSIDEYNQIARAKKIEYKNKIIMIPQIFIKKFDEWHSPHIYLTTESIANIVNNEIYPDERVKLLSIIEVFNIAFKLTIEDAINSINQLNGELERELEEQFKN